MGGKTSNGNGDPTDLSQGLNNESLGHPRSGLRRSRLFPVRELLGGAADGVGNVVEPFCQRLLRGAAIAHQCAQERLVELRPPTPLLTSSSPAAY